MNDFAFSGPERLALNAVYYGSVPGMTETAGSPTRPIKVIDYLKLRLNYLGKDHLGDPHAARYGESLFRVIDQNDLDLTAIVGVDRPGGIEKRDPMFDRKAAPGTDLGLEVLRKGDDDACGDQNPVPRMKGDRLLAGGQKIDAARAFGHVLRKGKPFEMR